MPINPCGVGVDFLRSCHEADVRVFTNSEHHVKIRWYFVPWGTPTLPFPTSFASSTWLSEQEQQVDLGEQPSTRSWVDGSPPPWGVDVSGLSCAPPNDAPIFMHVVGSFFFEFFAPLVPGDLVKFNRVYDKNWEYESDLFFNRYDPRESGRFQLDFTPFGNSQVRWANQTETDWIATSPIGSSPPNRIPAGPREVWENGGPTAAGLLRTSANGICCACEQIRESGGWSYMFFESDIAPSGGYVWFVLSFSQTVAPVPDPWSFFPWGFFHEGWFPVGFFP